MSERINREPSTSAARVLRHCPRCGVAPLVASARGRFNCEDCAFVFYFDVAAAVAAIIRDDEGRILLTRRAHDPERGKLDIPGGFVDAGETAEESLRREAREELGLEIFDLRFFCTVPNVYQYVGLTYNTLDVYYTCRARDLSVIRAGDDVSDFAFVPITDIPSADIGFDSVRKALARLAAGALPWQ